MIFGRRFFYSLVMTHMEFGMKEFDGNLSEPHISKIYENGFVIFYETDNVEDYERIDFEVRLGKEVVAEAFFVKSGGILHCNDVEVSEKFRRKGIATSLYVAAEDVFKCPASNIWDDCESQTEMGRILWEQPNRPFGNKS